MKRALSLVTAVAVAFWSVTGAFCNSVYAADAAVVQDWDLSTLSGIVGAAMGFNLILSGYTAQTARQFFEDKILEFEQYSGQSAPDPDPDTDWKISSAVTGGLLVLGEKLVNWFNDFFGYMFQTTVQSGSMQILDESNYFFIDDNGEEIKLFLIRANDTTGTIGRAYHAGSTTQATSTNMGDRIMTGASVLSEGTEISVEPQTRYVKTIDDKANGIAIDANYRMQGWNNGAKMTNRTGGGYSPGIVYANFRLFDYVGIGYEPTLNQLMPVAKTSPNLWIGTNGGETVLVPVKTWCVLGCNIAPVSNGVINYTENSLGVFNQSDLSGAIESEQGMQVTLPPSVTIVEYNSQNVPQVVPDSQVWQEVYDKIAQNSSAGNIVFNPTYEIVNNYPQIDNINNPEYVPGTEPETQPQPTEAPYESESYENLEQTGSAIRGIWEWFKENFAFSQIMRKFPLSIPYDLYLIARAFTYENYDVLEGLPSYSGDDDQTYNWRYVLRIPFVPGQDPVEIVLDMDQVKQIRTISQAVTGISFVAVLLLWLNREEDE